MTCWPIPVFLTCLLGFTVLLKECVSLFVPVDCRRVWCIYPCLLGFKVMKGLAFSSSGVCCDFAVCKWLFLLSYRSLNQCHSLKQQSTTRAPNCHIHDSPLCVLVCFLFMYNMLRPDRYTFYYEDFLEVTQSFLCCCFFCCFYSFAFLTIFLYEFIWMLNLHIWSYFISIGLQCVVCFVMFYLTVKITSSFI